MLLLISEYLRVDSSLQEEKRALAASRDNLDGLYHDASNSLTILDLKLTEDIKIGFYALPSGIPTVMPAMHLSEMITTTQPLV